LHAIEQRGPDAAEEAVKAHIMPMLQSGVE
jgi:hypothetical protein